MGIKFSNTEAITVAIAAVVGTLYALVGGAPSIGAGVMVVSMAALFFGGFAYLVMQYGHGKYGERMHKQSNINRLGGFLRRNALPLAVLAIVGFVLALLRI